MTNDDLMLKNGQPDEIQYEQLDVKEVIGAGELDLIGFIELVHILKIIVRWIR